MRMAQASPRVPGTGAGCRLKIMRAPPGDNVVGDRAGLEARVGLCSNKAKLKGPERGVERPEWAVAEGEPEQFGDAAASLPELDALPPDRRSGICANAPGFGSARKGGPSEWQIAILRDATRVTSAGRGSRRAAPCRFRLPRTVLLPTLVRSRPSSDAQLVGAPVSREYFVFADREAPL